MRFSRLGLAVAALFVGVAQAQTAGVVTFRANQTSATGSLAPVLTWSTNPAAVSCQAGGGWSGTKAASGTQTLPAISTSTNYTLTCSWGGDRARLSWAAPATNTNGTPINDLQGFRVVYGTSATALTQSRLINDVTARTTTVSPLASGTWFFAIRAVNTSQRESGNSNVAQMNVTPATAAGTVAITIAATPPPTTPPPTTPPPTGSLLTSQINVFDVATRADGSYRLVNFVGHIPLSRPCNQAFVTFDGYYGVSRSDVLFHRPPASTNVVARCTRN